MTQVIDFIGGEYRNRTGVHGFAIRCVTTPPTRRRCGRGGNIASVSPPQEPTCGKPVNAPLPRLDNCGKRVLIKSERMSLVMTDYGERRTVMVDTQVRPSDVTKFPIIDSMLTVPREAFVPHALRDAAYMGKNLQLGENRVVLEPRTLAKMLDVLDIQNNELVLDVGSALGYSAAVIARMAELVIAVEDNADHADEAQTALSELNFDNVIVHQGALTDGAAEHGPYDVIVVEGGVEILPKSLLSQLKIGGRIACLVMDGGLGEMRLGRKSDDGMTWRSVFNAAAPVLPGFERAEAFQL